MDNRIEDIQEQYKDQVGKELTREQAKEEMVAAACEMMLKNSEVFEKLARQNLTLAQRIKAGLDGFIKKLSANRKAAFENLDATSPEARAIAASETSLKETQKLWDNALKGAIKENEGGRAGKDTMLELRDEGRYNAEYEKPLTSEDVETLHSIGRKSIKDFTSEDIAKTQKWAYKFYRELGTKSPFFRASFGEWRAYDTSKVKRISVSNINLDEALAAMQRGTVKNTDSNWNINVGSLGAKDTISHSGREKISAKMLSEIDQIIENAVLLDTETSQRSSNNKHNDTAWMHKLYAFVDYNDTPYIAKITVEEYGVNESARRFYNLRGIKIEPIGGAPDVKTSYGAMPVIDSTTSIANSPNGILSVSEGLTDGKSATANNTVAALYNFVKRFDKDFSAGAAVNPILLNKDGTPKVFYHGAKKNGGFTEFRPWQYFTAQKNYAQRYAERGNDNSLYAVYLRADKAFDTRDAEAKQIFENIRQEYGLGELQDTGLPDWTDGYDISDYLDEHPELGYDAIILDEGGDLVDGKPVSRGESIVIKDSSQIKSATDNIGTFDKGNRDILYELRDNQGRELTKAQAEKFKDSQVRDKDGRLKTVYHGSSAVFNVFSADFMSQHGSSEGQGFYFTDYKDMAEGYQKKGGQLLEGYLNITNPLSDSEVTLSAPEVKRLLKALDPTGDDVILNYDSQGGMGYPSKAWYNRALADTVNMIMSTSESDSEILAEIANAGAGSGNVMDAVRKVLGYDGYIVEGKYGNANVYVAFGSDQFKSFDNKTPTSSPDIHLELRSDENQFNPRKELSNLFMQIAQNEQEKKSLRSYQAAIHELNNTGEAREQHGICRRVKGRGIAPGRNAFIITVCRPAFYTPAPL